MARNDWISGATITRQVDTVQVTGTWANGETLKATIGNVSVTVTAVTGSLTVNDIAAALKAALAGETSPNNCTINWDTSDTQPFAELSYSVSTDTVTITGPATGWPFTVAFTETAAAGGVTHSAAATAATGPNHVSNVENWSQGSLPADGDEIWILSTSDLLHDLDALTGVTPAAVYHLSTANIGLSEINSEGANSYEEYRERFWELGASADATNMKIQIGDPNRSSSGSSRVNLNLVDSQSTVTVYATGSRIDSRTPPVLLKGSSTSNKLVVLRGDVGGGCTNGDAYTVKDIVIGYVTNPASDSTLELGPDATIAGSPTLEARGGKIITHCAASGIDAEIRGAELECNDGSWTTIRALRNEDTQVQGRVRWNTASADGTLSTFHGYGGGILDLEQNDSAKTVTTANLHKDSGYWDRHRTTTNNLTCVGCTISEVDFRDKLNGTITRA